MLYQGNSFRYETNVNPDDETVRHLESRAKIYAEERKKQQVDSLEKALADAKSKLEQAKAKAAKKNPKEKEKEKGRDAREKDEEPSAEELAVIEAERTVSAAEKAKARVEEAPPDVQPVPFLEKVFEDLVPAEDVSSGVLHCLADEIEVVIPCLSKLTLAITRQHSYS